MTRRGATYLRSRWTMPWSCRYFTPDKTELKRISLSLLSPGDEPSNIPKHCHGISFREMAALAEALKELAADSELESEVVLRPRLEPFVELDLQ